MLPIDGGQLSIRLACTDLAGAGGPTQGAGHSAAKTFTGGAIAFYAVFDTLTLGVAMTALVIFVFNPLIVFVAAAVGLTLLNYACCTWVDREWATGSQGPARRSKPSSTGFGRVDHEASRRLGDARLGRVVCARRDADKCDRGHGRCARGGRDAGARSSHPRNGCRLLDLFVGVYTLIGWGASAVVRDRSELPIWPQVTFGAAAAPSAVFLAGPDVSCLDRATDSDELRPDSCIVACDVRSHALSQHAGLEAGSI